MKTYTLFLDIFILSLLTLAVYFQVTDYTVTDLDMGRRGISRIMIISWQSLLFIATFCVLLRYIALKTAPEKN